MAFILGVTRKLLGNHKANLQQILGLLIEPWGTRNYLELVWKCFSIGKLRNLEKNFTWGYSRIFGKFQFPVSRSRPEVENMTLHSFRVNSIYPLSFIQIGLRVSEISRLSRDGSHLKWTPSDFKHLVGLKRSARALQTYRPKIWW